MQKREMEELPQKIEALESEQKKLFASMSDPLFYKKQKEAIAGMKADLERLERAIKAAYRRWEELENMNSPEAK